MVAEKVAFIYILYAPLFNCIYIGQTRSSYGAIGRLTQHISFTGGNTFRQKLERYFNLEDVDIGKLEFVAFRLSPRSEFRSRASDYREAVEYSIQKEVMKYIYENSLNLGCVSRVRANSYVKQEFVATESTQASKVFTQWISDMVVDIP